MAPRRKPEPPAISRHEIKRLRKSMGLTQGELAERLGVHRQLIYRWESGLNEVKSGPARVLLERLLHEHALRDDGPAPWVNDDVLCTACRARIIWVRDHTNTRVALDREPAQPGAEVQAYDLATRRFKATTTGGYVRHDCPLKTQKQRLKVRLEWNRILAERESKR